MCKKLRLIPVIPTFTTRSAGNLPTFVVGHFEYRSASCCSPTMRLLALHGKQQNAEVFQTRCSKLMARAQREKLVTSIYYHDGPHLLPLKPGDEVPMRAWYQRRRDGGIDQSSLDQTFTELDAVWRDHGPFEGIFGFSMGGAMATIIASMPARYPGLRFVVVSGAPDLDTRSINNTFAIPRDLLSLHMVGLEDKTVMPRSSQDLAKRYNNAKVVEHELGHCVPMKAPHVQVFMDFIKDMHSQLNQTNGTKPLESLPLPVPPSATAPGATASKQAQTPTARESKPVRVTEIFRCATDEVAQLQCEEIEVLSAMYPTEFTLTAQDPAVSTATATATASTEHIPAPPVKAGDLCAAYHVLLVLEPGMFDPQVRESLPMQWLGNIGLQFTLPAEYPLADVARVSVTTGKLSMHDGFSDSKVQALEEHMQQAMVPGDACAMLCIQAATDWFYSGMWNATTSGAIGANSTEIGTDAVSNSTSYDNSLSEKAYEEVVDEVVEAEHIRLATAEAFAAAYAASIAAASQKEHNHTAGKAEKGAKDRDREAAALLPPSARGVWNYTVGLVGKPSAGKSTFYNAVTRAALERGGRLMAEVAPHPFTTIEPNVGPGWYASFEAESLYATTTNTTTAAVTSGTNAVSAGASKEDVEQYRRYPLHGRASLTPVASVGAAPADAQTGRRLLPVIVKDVAGLVPGAYKGRGKGNRFLADLCDADVLVHVVDITGQADRDGNAIVAVEPSGEAAAGSIGEDKGSSPMEDAEWIREELHRWIYGNVRAKWNSVLACTRGAPKGTAAPKGPATQQQRDRTAQRVLALFTGYQGPKWNVELAAHRAGLQLTHASEWSAQDLHRMVAHFLSIRFPVCLALNKIDSLGRGAEQQAVIQHCVDTARLRGEAAVPVSARAECWLLNDQAAALHSTVVAAARDGKTSAAEAALYKDVMARYGTTGVLEAISAAVGLKPPVLCYPVCDLDSELPVGWTPGKATNSSSSTSSNSSSASASSSSGPTVVATAAGATATNATSGASAVGASAVAGVNAGHVSAIHCPSVLPRLQDCLQFKPGSTVGDVFEALKRGALSSSAAVVHGEFVRADGRPLTGTKVTQLRKDSVLDANIAVLRVQTNRKSVWQGGAAPVIS